jgi:hypothetical protein
MAVMQLGLEKIKEINCDSCSLVNYTAKGEYLVTVEKVIIVIYDTF